MTQEEVLQFMKENCNTFFCSKDVSTQLVISLNRAGCGLLKLSKSKFLMREERKVGNIWKNYYIYVKKDNNQNEN